MSYFSWLADELTEIEERLAETDLAEISGALRKAINKAFVKACEADRAQRLARAALAAASEPSFYGEEGPSFGWRPGGGATGGAIRVRTKADGKSVTAPIEDPIAAPSTRRTARPKGSAPPPRSAGPPGAEAG